MKCFVIFLIIIGFAGTAFAAESEIPPPLKQIHQGISAEKIQCKENLVLIQKFDGTPACVKQKTVSKLIERGWATDEESEYLILKEGQSWGYIKNISILDENLLNVTTSYPTNAAHHMSYPDEYQSIIADCNMKNDSSVLSLVYLKEISVEQKQAKFRKETKTFDGLQCDDAFWKEMTTRGYCGPPSQLIHRVEDLVPSIEEANSKTNFVLDVPSYLPEGYSIQKITVDSDGTYAMLFASQEPVSNEMYGCEFTWNDEGIFLFYTKFAENFDFDTRYAKYGEEPKKKLITINGNPGYAENRWVGDRFGMPIPQQSKVVLYMLDEKKIFEVHSSLSADELVKIAESISLQESQNNEFYPVDPVDNVNANNQFAIDFYSKISQSNNNVFFSPTSISTAFSILYEGARENTANEIQDVFGFPTNEIERKHGYYSLHKIINESNNENVRLHIANALWLAESFEPLPEYLNTATKYYDSTVASVDFVSDDGVNKINEWVNSKTEEKIEKLLEPGSTGANTRMAITNAIYFKGMWEYTFDPEDTYEVDFMVNPDETEKVQMMTFPHKMRMNFASTEQMKMLELPYKNNTASMLIILPNEIDGLRSVEDSLTLENLSNWKNMLQKREIVIHIPKFSLETDYNLKETLPDMGMTSAFNIVHADFSGISGYKGLYISQAIHKAFVDVNEEGTEAAGATAIVMDESGGQLFKADHPFIFIIQDKKTNSILFIGKIVEPVLKEK